MGDKLSKDVAKIFCKFCKGKIEIESHEEFIQGYHDCCFNDVMTFQTNVQDQFKTFINIYGRTVKKYNNFNLGVKLTDLYLDNLDIVVLSDTIGCFQNLQALKLNENKLTDLPLTISITLTRLELKENKFTLIPQIVFSLENLITLILTDNKITEIPPTISNLTNLEYLYLSNNNISVVPQSINNLKHLSYLRLAGNKFSTFPIITFYLEFLDLSNNKIISIPKAIKKMSVNNLILDDNPLKTLPDEIWKINYLYNLSIKRNKLSHLSSTLGYESVLEGLDVEGNELSNLPDSLVQAPLTYVNLSNNKFNKIPSCILQLEKLEEFYFNNMQLFEIPKKFFKPTLKYVEFANCGLKKIPDSIGMSIKLRNLIVPFNDLTELPDSICNLSDFEKLDITNNPIKKLPDELHKTNICYLFANNTKLEELPDSIGKCNIIEYHLGGTNIHSLPDFNPDKDPDKYIKILDIRDTLIETIPESISNIKIQKICISKNESLKEKFKLCFRDSSNTFNCIIEEDPEKEYYNKRPTINDFTPIL